MDEIMGAGATLAAAAAKAASIIPLAVTASSAPAADEVKNPQPNYYRSRGPDIADAFRNFDDKVNFDCFERWAHESTRDSFIVDYGDDQAWCAFDLGPEQFEKLIRAPRPSSLNTRWINIWRPYRQQDTVKVLAAHYDFSPRLLGVMQSKPGRPIPKPQPPSKPSSSLFHRSQQSSTYTPSATDSQTLSASQASHPSSDLSKLENGFHLTDLSASSVEKDPLKTINHWTMVQQVWHWSSVDWGRKYMCLGYNSLHDTRMTGVKADDSRESTDMPHGKRTWTWLLICDDRTVITINEDPFPYCPEPLTETQRRELVAIRHNQINVFRQLSKGYDPSQDSPLAQLPIRRRIGYSLEESAHRPMDAPGLLFYCLFDDWQTSYSLVVRRYHHYSDELDTLRKDMLEKAELSHIDRLHRIGRQVAVLKRIYLSYEQIIVRVLEKQEPTAASLKNSHVIHEDDLSASSSALGESQSGLGGFLTSAARVRFERLKYRIRLYALSEIDECLDQKESLVMMNFNLIAIKESYSVERLTRVTLLLAKVTILFMPVSLSTAYFSTQLDGIVFTFNAYWITFGVILALSIVALVLFGLYTGTMEGRMLSRSFGKRFVDFWKGRRKKRKERLGKVQ